MGRLKDIRILLLLLLLFLLFGGSYIRHFFLFSFKAARRINDLHILNIESRPSPTKWRARGFDWSVWKLDRGWVFFFQTSSDVGLKIDFLTSWQPLKWNTGILREVRSTKKGGTDWELKGRAVKIRSSGTNHSTLLATEPFKSFQRLTD